MATSLGQQVPQLVVPFTDQGLVDQIDRLLALIRLQGRAVLKCSENQLRGFPPTQGFGGSLRDRPGVLDRLTQQRVDVLLGGSVQPGQRLDVPGPQHLTHRVLVDRRTQSALASLHPHVGGDQQPVTGPGEGDVAQAEFLGRLVDDGVLLESLQTVAGVAAERRKVPAVPT